MRHQPVGAAVKGRQWVGWGMATFEVADTLGVSPSASTMRASTSLSATMRVDSCALYSIFPPALRDATRLAPCTSPCTWPAQHRMHASARCEGWPGVAGKLRGSSNAAVCRAREGTTEAGAARRASHAGRRVVVNTQMLPARQSTVTTQTLGLLTAATQRCGVRAGERSVRRVTRAHDAAHRSFLLRAHTHTYTYTRARSANTTLYSNRISTVSTSTPLQASKLDRAGVPRGVPHWHWHCVNTYRCAAPCRNDQCQCQCQHEA